MSGNNKLSGLLIGAAVVALAELACVAAVEFTAMAPAQAQFRDNMYRQRAPQQGGGFFNNLFGPQAPVYEEPRQDIDYSRAPSARKPDRDAPPPTTSILVMGDGMADWLAYGLEDAFSDNPEIAVTRRNKNHSGLLKYDPKSDLDWAHAVRDILAKEKANYVVMMLGASDRQSIRASDVAKEADKKEADKKAAEQKKAKEQQDKSEADKKKAADKPDADKSAQNKDAPAKVQDAEAAPDQPSIIAPEPTRRVSGSVEFRTDQWAEIYGRRIDETTAALKSKGVPVFWVGLPSIRGTRTNADVVYLNDLYRARAERAGAIYVDVWDGFVDESGKFTASGPDFEGQTRKLRSGDGVYFTKYGARKLAHYVERELRRYMSNRALPVALPTGPIVPPPSDGKPQARPLAGPVVPLTVTPGNSDELLGGASTGSPYGDSIASRALVKGEPMPAPPGRADDFVWPRGNDNNSGPPVAALSAAATAASASAAPDKPAEPKSGAAGKTTQVAPEKPKPQRPPLRYDNSRPSYRSANPLGWLR